MPDIATIRDVTVTAETVEVDLSNKELTDEEFADLEPFNKIQSLMLDCNKLTDTSVSIIAGKFSCLKKLLLSSNNFTAAALVSLPTLTSLRILQLNSNMLGD